MRDDPKSVAKWLGWAISAILFALLVRGVIQGLESRGWRDQAEEDRRSVEFAREKRGQR